MINHDCLMSPKEAAEYVGMSVHWLERQRGLGRAPDFIQLGGKGGKVFYRQSVLDALIVARTVLTSNVGANDSDPWNIRSDHGFGGRS
jgi:hypothetical protein